VEGTIVNDLDRILSELENPIDRRSFSELPDQKDVYYAVWVDRSGANDLTAVSPEPIREGIIYVGECVEQGAHRHLAHNQIGSLTLMKNLAALFRHGDYKRRDGARGSKNQDSSVFGVGSQGT
jgi:hypothetical protein